MMGLPVQLLVLLSVAACEPALRRDQAGLSQAGGHFRQEERTSDGTVRGRYGFTDANGYLRVIEYVADETGYHVIHTKTELPQDRPRPTVKPDAPFLGPLPPFIPRPQPEESET